MGNPAPQAEVRPRQAWQDSTSQAEWPGEGALPHGWI